MSWSSFSHPARQGQKLWAQALLSLFLLLIASHSAQAQDPWRRSPAPPLIPRPLLPSFEGAGRATPQQAPPAQALELLWDDAGMRTLLIIGSAIDARRSLAHVVIWEQGDRDPRQLFQVAYAAIAFYDQQGALHIDGRAARLRGPMAHAWWPDSFALYPEEEDMQILDDAGNRGHGRITASWPAEKNPLAYRRALSMRDLMLSLYL